MDKTKSQIAEEVLLFLSGSGLLDKRVVPLGTVWTDTVLDIQDIFSQYWDEDEVSDGK